MLAAARRLGKLDRAARCVHACDPATDFTAEDLEETPSRTLALAREAADDDPS